MSAKRSLPVTAFVLVLISLASAAQAQDEATLVSEFTSNSIMIIIAASAAVALATLAAMALRRKGEKTKWALFLIITISVAVATGYSAVSTVYLNVVSGTGGPVHWHADFEIWNCGQKVDLVDPTGIENRVGDPVLHDHGDDRIHVEGVLVRFADGSLGSFFTTVGGFMNGDTLIVPTNDGPVEMNSGETCGGREAELQVFVYKVTNPGDLKNWVFVQEKVDDFEDYVLAPYSTIPPGDCIILEFDEEKDRTDRICETMRIAIEKGELSGS